MWFDTELRTALPLGEAITACHAVGAEVASERDIVELLYLARPAAPGVRVQTSSLDFRGTTGTTADVIELEWTEATSYAGEQGQEWQTDGMDATPFLCRWTNELR